MSLTLITAPTVTPLSLAEAKAHLRVSHSDDDAIIQLYIQAATDYVDGKSGFLGRALVTQVWQLTLDAFPEDEIKIPLPPLQNIVSVDYDDAAGASQNVSALNFDVDSDSEPGWIVPHASFTWPTTLDAINSVRIQFTAGYLPNSDSPPNYAANVPFNVKAGLLLIIGTLYENREDNVAGVVINKMPFSAEMLLRRHKIDLGMA
jgi:uncharacterized phiE125 gp8 family phage protein